VDSRPRPEHTRLDYSDAGPGDATEPGSKLLRSNQQSRISCFARSADFKLGQQVAAESPAIACSSHQISMVAAAITTPVTSAAKHENSRRSFSTPVMAASPMRASHVGVSSPEGSSALLYRGGKVTSRSAKHERAPHVPTSPWARLGGVIQSGNPKGRLKHRDPAILIPVGCLSDISPIFLRWLSLAKSPTLRSAPCSSRLATDQRSKNSCA
jgi:hypothetical protein